MPPCNVKYVEMIHNFLVEQNRQLLKIIADAEDLDFDELAQKYLQNRSVFHDKLTKKTSSAQE